MAKLAYPLGDLQVELVEAVAEVLQPAAKVKSLSCCGAAGGSRALIGRTIGRPRRADLPPPSGPAACAASGVIPGEERMWRSKAPRSCGRASVMSRGCRHGRRWAHRRELPQPCVGMGRESRANAALRALDSQAPRSSIGADGMAFLRHRSVRMSCLAPAGANVSSGGGALWMRLLSA